MPSTNQTVSVVNVTPAQARRWLATNTNNRRLRKRHIAFLTGIINRGEWALSNDAICLDSEGKLLNGQHRLNAIAESGQTLPMLVMTNVGRATQLSMDTGAKRNAAEQMQIMGVAGASTMKAALCRAILNFDNTNGPTNRSENVSNAEIIELAEGDRNIDTAIAFTVALGRHLPGARVTMIALGYYLLLDAWPDRVPEFHTKLAEGVELGMNDPVRRLRNYLVSGVRQAGWVDRRKMLALFLKTFNYWVDSKELEVLVYRQDEDWPMPYTPMRYTELTKSRARAAKGRDTLRKRRVAS